MTPFFTKEGDMGDTGYLGSGRISKASLRIEAVGCVDEATAYLGFARSIAGSKETCSIILHVQNQLYYLMSELSTDPHIADQFNKIGDADVKWLETQIEVLENAIELPREFIIPGENPASGALAVARTVVRRAERRTVALLETGAVQKPLLVAYLNRLSSLIFMLEVFESSISGTGVRLTKKD